MKLFPKTKVTAVLSTILLLSLITLGMNGTAVAFLQARGGQLTRALWVPQIYGVNFGTAGQANTPKLTRSDASEVTLSSGAMRFTLATPLIFEGATDDGFETSFLFTDPTADNVFTVPDVTSDTFMFLAATQTLTNKTLTSPIIGTSIVLDQTTEDYTVTWADPAAARAISIVDPGGTDVFVWRDFAQTLLAKTLTNPIIPVANPLEGAASNVPRWLFKQVDHTDMTAAGTAATFTLFTLPANTMIHDVVGTVVTAWEAVVGLSAAVCSVGTAAGGATDLALDDNFFAAATVYELHDATASGGKGSLLFDSTDKFAPFMLVTSGDIEIQCDLTGDDHADTNAGQARIYILVSQPLANTATEAN